MIYNWLCKKSFWLLLINWAAGVAYLSGQGKLLLKLESEVYDHSWFEKEFQFGSNYRDSISMHAGLTDLIDRLHQSAFLEASVDEISRLDSNLYQARLHIGKPYDWLALESVSVPRSWLAKAGFRKKVYEGKPFSFERFVVLKENILQQAENNGYPFARVWMDSFSIQQQSFSAKLILDKDSLVVIDGLKLDGGVRISNDFLQKYLGIEEEDLYNHSKILLIKNRIQELAFIDLREDPKIFFLGNRARVNLNLIRKRSSKFDFLIGVLPNNVEREGLQITGTFKGELLNQFGQGEKIYLAYEQLRPETQRLNIAFNYPFVMNLPFGADLKFDLYKRDSTYLDIKADFGIQYLFDGNSYLKAFWNSNASRLLAVQAQNFQQDQIQDLDYNQAYFGLEAYREALDYRFNPRKGWSFLGKFGAGTKRIRRNQELETLFENNNPFDSIASTTFQYQADIQAALFIPFFRRSTLKLGVNGGAIFSESPIYRNEQYRIGGNRLMRGYDEESLFATKYLVWQNEYRLLIGQNSYLFLFSDIGYIQDLTVVKNLDRQLLSFGAGTTFETSVGVFGLTVAFGRQQGVIDLQSPKVHFGYVSLF